MSKKNSRNKGTLAPQKQNKRIIQTGFRHEASVNPNIILQMPELFLFNMKSYMDSLQLAKSIDYASRVRLYDMYESSLLDLHLSGVLAKRLRGVTSFPVEFQRNGVPDDNINKQLRAPWFKQLRKEIILSEFWGFSLMQFFINDKGNIDFDLIDRKHYDPVQHVLLKYQGDQEGVPVEDFPNMLFVGTERGLGIFAETLPAVLYKRGDMADWAQFCNIFGMPIREYTYDAGDEDARRRLVQDARRQGANAVYIHPAGSNMNLIESGNKTGSSDLYKTFADYWDGKISIRVLGNTLTTDAKETGTQALGSVHKEEEETMNADDRELILDVLNYDMADIFNNLGFNTEGGEFVYAAKETMDPTVQLNIVQALSGMGLPMDDDWLYETFKVEKPKDYDAQIEEKKRQREALEKRLNGADGEQGPVNSSQEDDKKGTPRKPFEQPSNAVRKAVKDHLASFFGIAPK